MTRFGLLFLLSFTMLSCKKTEKDIVCDVAKEYAEAYYNMDIRKAKGYCVQDLYTIMDFRHSNLTKRDYDFQKAAGKVDVKVVGCNVDPDRIYSYVYVELSNFLRVNYMTDSLMIVPRDTVELILVKEVDGVWRIKMPA